MFKRKTLSLLTAAVAAAGFVSAANASTILSENFDSSTSAPAGWNLNVTGYSASSIYHYSGTGTDYSTSTPNGLEIATNYGTYAATTPTLDLSGGTTATISADYKWDGSAFGRYFYIDYSSDGSTWTNIYTDSKGHGNQGVPLSFSQTINAPSYAFSSNSQFKFYSSNASGGADDAIIDNVVVTSDVTPVPEPASLALMGLGGLLLISRRRRTQVDG